MQVDEGELEESDAATRQPALADDEFDDQPPAITAPPAPVDTTSTQRAWIGLIAAVIIMLPSRYSPIGFLMHVAVPTPSTATIEYKILVLILAQVVQTGALFAIIFWDGAPWAVFGLTKPEWSVDLITGCLTYVAHRATVLIGMDLFISFLDSFDYHFPRHAFPSSYARGQGVGDLLLFLVLALCVGFAEELSMRGYLIPRLERVLHSRRWALLVSAAFFGFVHLQAGILTVWHAFLSGIVYGIVFMWTRRLWPIAYAHALNDFAAFLFDPRI
jgi:membrane protease YdiL (CAAX protease family)